MISLESKALRQPIIDSFRPEGTRLGMTTLKGSNKNQQTIMRLFTSSFPLTCSGALALCGASIAQPASTPPVAVTSVSPSTAPVQQAAPPAAKPIKIGGWTLSGSLRARYENWHWLDTPGFDDHYDFTGVLLRTGLSRSGKNYDVNVELAAPLLLGLPDNAVAPAPRGQLGLGGSYELASEGRHSGIFAKQAFVKIKNLGGAPNSLKLGRFEFWDGGEVVPKNPTLAALKRDRIAHRLLGNFGYSHVGRSYDGAQFVRSTQRSNITVLAARPTEGVFDVDGWGEVKDVDVLYAAYTKPMKTADARIFVLHYRDDRQAPDSIKVDNRPALVRAADGDDISITTIGGHYLKNVKTGNGDIDLLAWGALQRGDWGNLKHRAHALALEAGYQPKKMKWKPWLRAGYFKGSGDSDNTDGTHQTFFQVLPTPRIYARTPFYNMMNNEDVFASLILRPTPKLSVRADAHRLKLSEKNDLWYSGGGAFEDNSFGYAGRPSFGDDSLATLLDISIDYAASPTRSFGFYYGHARGGKVIENIYAGKSLNYFYIEATQKF
jgi:hypothetical protein